MSASTKTVGEGRMGKSASEHAPTVDVDGYRERVAAAVELEVSELIANAPNNPNAEMLRMVAAYFLSSQDQLPVGDIARVLARPESWVRASTDYVERRIRHYFAFGFYVEKTMASYAIANMRSGKVPREAVGSRVDIDGHRARVAGAVGMTAVELVALSSDQDTETTQKVAAFLLLSTDQLAIGDVARIIDRDDQWLRAAQNYVRRNMKRNQELKAFVEKATAAYTSQGNQKSLGVEGR